MPEELLRNRNKYEERLYACDTKRKPGTGDVEDFRTFILNRLRAQDDAFFEFHDAVAPCTADSVRQALKTCNNEEVKKWLAWYLNPK